MSSSWTTDGSGDDRRRWCEGEDQYVQRQRAEAAAIAAEADAGCAGR